MILRTRSAAGATLAFLLATTFPALAGASVFGKKKVEQDTMPGRKLTAAQNALIDKAILREKDVTKVVKERAPLVETYIQNMKPDPVLLQVPESDQHFLARVDFSKVINDDEYKPNKGNFAEKKGKFDFFKNSLSALGGISGSLRLTFHESGFVQMILMDSNSFDRQHYTFTFIRNDFLGNIPTAVFDVSPISGKREFGRFFGRIWVETQGGNVVRFNGDFAGTIETMKEFYHFDSWRTNVQPNLWLPTSFYVEESDPKSTSSTLKFKAINYVWGYVLKVPVDNAENTSLDVVNAQDVSNDAPDVSPLGAQREWVQQAEDNVIERLFQAGLLDAPSDFDKTLEAARQQYPGLQQHSDVPPHPRAHPAHRAAGVARRRQHHHHLQEPDRHHQRALHRRRPADGQPERHPRLPTGPHHPRPSPGHQVRLQRPSALPLHLGLRAHPHAPHRGGQRRSRQEGPWSCSAPRSWPTASSTSASTCSSCRSGSRRCPPSTSP
jgi:hypothetical protein